MRVRRRLGAVVIAIALIIASGAAPHAAAVAGGAAFRMNLAEAGDFVSQADPHWCIPASMQMMLNIVRPTNDGSVATQKALLELARSYRNPSFTGTGNGQIRGASGRGWAAGLTTLGAGPYRITSAATLEEAAELVARAIRSTGRPAGIVVWKGTHAWVVSGFEATADPAASASVDVTALVVMDPWYPRSTRAYGASPRPGTTMSMKQLAKEFLPWSRPDRTSKTTGRFVVLIPYAATRAFDRLGAAA